MPNRPTIWTAGIVAVVCFGALDAQAEETGEPWEPKEFSQSELIDFGTFEKTPLEFPWKTVRVEQVATGSGIDFKHVLDANYADVESHFQERFEDDQHALKLKPFAAGRGVARELHIMGITTRGETLLVTLGNDDTRRQYTVELMREDGETMLIFKNVAYSMSFGAGVPQRAPFVPVDAAPVPLED